MWDRERALKWSTIFLRISLAAGFLSAVADRFGLWGPPGTPNVAWGAFEPFLAYTKSLLWFVPASLVPVAGWVATVLEIILGIGLLVGTRLAVVALASGVLLSIFGISMTIALGPEPAFSYSVWSAAAGAFLLAALLSSRECAKTA